MNEQGFGVNNQNQTELYKTYIANSPKSLPNRRNIKQKVNRIKSNLNQTTNHIFNNDQYSDFIKKEDVLINEIAHTNNEETNALLESNLISMKSFKKLMPKLSEHPNLRPNLSLRSNTPSNFRTKLKPISSNHLLIENTPSPNKNNMSKSKKNDGNEYE